MRALFHLPPGYNDWRVALGATAHVGRLGVVLLILAAALAIGLSTVSLVEERRGRGVVLLGLRVLGVLACLLTALQPAIAITAARLASARRFRRSTAKRRKHSAPPAIARRTFICSRAIVTAACRRRRQASSGGGA